MSRLPLGFDYPELTCTETLDENSTVGPAFKQPVLFFWGGGGFSVDFS